MCVVVGTSISIFVQIPLRTITTPTIKTIASVVLRSDSSKDDYYGLGLTCSRLTFSVQIPLRTITTGRE